MQIGCFTTFHYSEELTEEKDRYDHHYYWMLRHNPAQIHAMHENYYISNYNILPNVREHEKYWELNSKTGIYLYYCAGLYFLKVGSGNKHLVTLTDAKRLLEEMRATNRRIQTPVETDRKASQRRMSEKEIRFNAYAIMAARQVCKTCLSGQTLFAQYEYEKRQTGDKI